MPSDNASILIVDDNPAVRDLLAAHMERLGHTPSLAENGRVALGILKTLHVDLILLDIMMPEMNGYQVLEILKADPHLRHIPVIVISAVEDMKSIVRCIQLGAQDYLAKPFQALILRARVEASLERKRLHDELAAANRAKSEFVSMVAHELKTPMTTIKGYTDLLLGGAAGPISEKQTKFLQAIRAGIQRMGILVSDLNDITRVETGQLYLEMDAVSAAEVVGEVVASAKGEMDAREQTLRVKVERGLPPLHADRHRVIQILGNLLSNASKYTPPGGTITLHVERAADSPATMAHFCVADTGIGIAPEEHPKVFRKFFRSRNEAAHKQAGTGLGLSITKGLVEAQGGRIWFESAPGKGSAFHFTLPFAPPNPES